MTEISADTLLSNLHWRYATKQFDASKKIPAATWSALEQSLVLAPSSFGLQPWKFIDVTDAALREKLKAASWGQSQVTDASHLVVLARKLTTTVADVDKLIARMGEVRGVDVAALAPYRGFIVGWLQSLPPEFDLSTWAAKQVYIALGQFMVTAANLGVDVCPMEGFDPAQYDELLGLSGTGYSSTVIAPAGYRSPEDKYAANKKVRYSADELIVRK